MIKFVSSIRYDNYLRIEMIFYYNIIMNMIKRGAFLYSDHQLNFLKQKKLIVYK